MMTPGHDDYRGLDQRYIWHPFTPMKPWLADEPLVIERAQGVYLYDTQGNRYIDGVSSLWCNVHGHNHPHINAAIRRQLDKVAHSTLLGLASEPAAKLGEKLVQIAPDGLKRVFYSDSGATAVEIALKIAFQYWRNLGRQRNTFIALKQSYHGDTLGAVSVGGINVFHEIFGPLTFSAQFAENPHPYRFEGSADRCREHCLSDLKRLLELHQSDVAAIIVEPLVQGAAGILVHPEGYLAGVRQLADEYDTLLIADEVAVGLGRTGTMFACPQEQVSPDILCVAKGLTGGYLPLAATLTTDQVFDAFLNEPTLQTTFYHGHTYTGNALGCAAALASLEVFEREDTLAGLKDKISLIGGYLGRFAGKDFVGDVRQKGMMAGIELVEDKGAKQPFDSQRRIGAKFCQSLRCEGLILRPLGDVIVLMPPLSISMVELKTMLEIVGQGIDRIGSEILKV